ncbi:hypothetical protein GF402_05510 [Candidatus Fermentibacteria bacterium]|nr:hypothetical protein [Candidatus Fermentibacteria bacterium]
MTSIGLLVLLSAIQSGVFRVGGSFDASYPFMGDERDYADLLSEGDIDMDLSTFAWSGSIEALGDISRDVRLRGNIGVRRYSGAYGDKVDPFTYLFVGMFTGGIGFLFPPGDETITIHDEAITVEASAYYKLNDGPALLSVGGGPMVAFVTRDVDTPYTRTEDTGTGFGLNAAFRIDQEPAEKFLGCLPVTMGGEVGFRYCDVPIEDSDFSVDFTGPYARFGTYVAFE